MNQAYERIYFILFLWLVGRAGFNVVSVPIFPLTVSNLQNDGVVFQKRGRFVRRYVTKLASTVDNENGHHPAFDSRRLVPTVSASL